MLPDFVEVKQKLQIQLDKKLRQANLWHLGPLANIRESVVFEGNRTVLIRADGSVEEQKAEAAVASIEVESAEVEEMTAEKILDKVDGAAEKIAQQQANTFYRYIDKLAEEVGNVVSARGDSFTIEGYFEMLEKMEIDFDEAGNPELPCVVTSSGQHSVVERVLEDLEVPENKIRFNEIIKDKREEWRARESNRKLVG